MNIFKEKFTKLAQRRKEMVVFAVSGNSNPRIAELMNISYGTVKSEMSEIFKLLEVPDRTVLAYKAGEIKLLEEMK